MLMLLEVFLCHRYVAKWSVIRQHLLYRTYFNCFILKKKEIWPKCSLRKIWLHLDNCRVHNTKQMLTEMGKIPYRRTPHPPYSPDLAPSDFYLFGRVKNALEGLELG